MHGDVLDTLVRLRTAAPGRAGIWWYRGDFFGRLEGELTQPLLKIEGVSLVNYAALSGKQYRFHMDEAGFFLDQQTNEVVERWRNPFNQRDVSPQHYRSVAHALVGPDGFAPDGKLPPGMQFSGKVSSPVIQGDTIWVNEDIFARVHLPDGKTQVLTSLSTFQGKLAELAKPDFVPATLSFSTLGSWLPWMEMDNTAGVISWRLMGRKLSAAAELPERLASLLRERQPDLLAAIEEA